MPQPFSPSLAEPVQASQLLPHSPGWSARHPGAQRTACHLPSSSVPHGLFPLTFELFLHLASDTEI